MSAVTGDDYVRFCEGVRELSGIDLTQYKRPQMERRLRSFFERQGIKRLTDALRSLGENRAELEALLDRMTINVSQLWRNPEQWELLERVILPELAAGGKPLQAWSAGSSYGAEAFTLAAICRSAIPRTSVRITGTDIDRRMVERAREAVFNEADARTAPAEYMKRYFEPVADGFKARPELIAMTHFEVGDLLRIRPPAGRYDLILCRNTVIYFDEPIRDELHARLASALRPGGYLVIGGTERVSYPAQLGLRATHPFTFRKA